MAANFGLLFCVTLSAAISIFIYLGFKEFIVSNGNESKILNFYKKDINSYKTLEKFLKVRKTVQTPLAFMLIGSILATVAYVIGLLVLTMFVTYILNKPNSIDPDSDFSVFAYLLGVVLILSSKISLFIKAKELMKHFEKVGKK